jgi:hypothetical protein
MITICVAHHVLRRFANVEASKDDDDEDATVEEIVMEGNPKAPKFHIEHHTEPPRDAYVEQVSMKFFDIFA